MQQVSDLRADCSLALALATELNGYPGLVYVLERADTFKRHCQLRGLWPERSGWGMLAR